MPNARNQDAGTVDGFGGAGTSTALREFLSAVGEAAGAPVCAAPMFRPARSPGAAIVLVSSLPAME
ncbi:hypothetical protein [Streptomyces sp. NPDC048385]|uniref:hypothetical protein n=1 Tax=unclassified Streptomyces TaxID=2593676 RepID=UPI00344625E8